VSARRAIFLVPVVFASALLLLGATGVRAAPPVPTVGEVLADGAKRFAQLNADALDLHARRLQHLLGIKTVDDMLREQKEAILRELVAEVGRRMQASTPLLGKEGSDTNLMKSMMRRTNDH
jgi:hypothetical protein